MRRARMEIPSCLARVRAFSKARRLSSGWKRSSSWVYPSMPSYFTPTTWTLLRFWRSKLNPLYNGWGIKIPCPSSQIENAIASIALAQPGVTIRSRWDFGKPNIQRIDTLWIEYISLTDWTGEAISLWVCWGNTIDHAKKYYVIQLTIQKLVRNCLVQKRVEIT